MKICILCGKVHEPGTPHPINDIDKQFWGERLNLQPIEVQPKIEEKQRGRPRKDRTGNA